MEVTFAQRAVRSGEVERYDGPARRPTGLKAEENADRTLHELRLTTVSDCITSVPRSHGQGR